jgi:hypothetical protein
VLGIAAMAALPSTAMATHQVFSGVGGNNTSPTPGSANAGLTAFEAAIGGINNANGPASAGGFRTVNWDGVPDSSADPFPLPGEFFSARGAFLATPGNHLEVSASSGTGKSFGDFNANYQTYFPPFSPLRLFTPVGSNETEVSFLVPHGGNRGSTIGFGAIFVNNRLANSSAIEYFDPAGRSIGKFFSPAGTSGQAEFLGVLFSGETVARVRITSGTTPLGPDDNLPTTNVVVLDDFAYGEPQPLPSPTLTVASPVDGATVSSPSLIVSGTVADAYGVGALTVNGSSVPVGPDGSWATPITLKPGANLIDVQARSVDGNSSEATRSVNYAPPPPGCVVPKLRGKKVKAARRALSAAHCTAGKVSHRHVKRKPGRVIGQKPKPGTVLAAGAPVKLTVGRR